MQRQPIKLEDSSDSDSEIPAPNLNPIPQPIPPPRHRFGQYRLEDFDYQFLQISTHKFPRWVQRHINPPPTTKRTTAIIKKQQERRLAFCARQKKLADSFQHLATTRNIPKRTDFPSTKAGEWEYTIALAKEQGEWLARNR